MMTKEREPTIDEIIAEEAVHRKAYQAFEKEGADLNALLKTCPEFQQRTRAKGHKYLPLGAKDSPATVNPGAGPAGSEAPPSPGAARDCDQFDPERTHTEVNRSTYSNYFRELVPSVVRVGHAHGLSQEMILALITQAYQEQGPVLLKNGRPTGKLRQSFNAGQGYRLYNEHAKLDTINGKIDIKPGQDNAHRKAIWISQGEYLPGSQGQVPRNSPTFVYDSPTNAVEDHIVLLAERWKADVHNLTMEKFFTRLQVAKYASDPAYGPHLLALSGQVKPEVRNWLKDHIAYLEALDKEPQIPVTNTMCVAEIEQKQQERTQRRDELRVLYQYLSK